jgi:hypothetical protein
MPTKSKKKKPPHPAAGGSRKGQDVSLRAGISVTLTPAARGPSAD